MLCWIFTTRYSFTWWQKEDSFHMKTSSTGNIFRVTGPLCWEFPAQRSETRSFDIFFDLRLNKQLNKQSWGWWFETLSRSLWRHCKASSPGQSSFVSICSFWLGNVFSILYTIDTPYISRNRRNGTIHLRVQIKFGEYIWIHYPHREYLHTAHTHTHTSELPKPDAAYVFSWCGVFFPWCGVLSWCGVLRHIRKCPKGVFSWDRCSKKKKKFLWRTWHTPHQVKNTQEYLYLECCVLMEQTVRSFFVVCTVPPSIGDKLKRRQYRRIEKGILEFSNKSSSWHSVNTTKGLTFLFQAISLMQIASKPTTDA